MSKKLLFTIIFSLAATTVFFFLFRGSGEEEILPGYVFPDSAGIVESDYSKGVLSVWSISNNAPVAINGNFSSSDVEELGEDYSKLFTQSDGEDGDLYGIYYDEVTQGILVTLFSEPIAETRNKAVSRMVEKLGISKESLCDLDISIITNAYVSPVYAGVELGVPGCPAAVVLE